MKGREGSKVSWVVIELGRGRGGLEKADLDIN